MTKARANAIALAQLNPHMGNIPANVARLVEARAEVSLVWRVMSQFLTLGRRRPVND